MQCRPPDRPRSGRRRADCPRARRLAGPPAGSVTDDDRRQPAKQYWPIRRASNNNNHHHRRRHNNKIVVVVVVTSVSNLARGRIAVLSHLAAANGFVRYWFPCNSLGLHESASPSGISIVSPVFCTAHPNAENTQTRRPHYVRHL